MLKTTKEQDSMLKELFSEMEIAIERDGLRNEYERSSLGKTICYSKTVGEYRMKALRIGQDKVISKEWTPEAASAFSQKFGRMTTKLYWNK